MRVARLLHVVYCTLAFVLSVAGQCPPDQVVLNGASLGNGVAVGLNTSGGRTDWLSNDGASLIMQYPSLQSWGSVFFSFGAAGSVGSRQSRDLSGCGNLVLEVSGDPGSVDIGVQDWLQRPDGSESKVTIQVSSQWQTVTIPLSRFARTDFTHVYVPAEVVFGGPQPQTVRVRSIKYTAGTPPSGRTGVLAHIAAGGGQWSTVVTLFNPSASPATVNVAFRGDDGAALGAVPLTVTQHGAAQTVTGGTVSAVLSPSSSIFIAIGDPSVQSVVGWADVQSSSLVNGFAVFRSLSASPSEGTVTLQAGSSAVILPYDNTGGFVTGVALANLSTSSATVTATAWDDSGNSLDSQPIALAGNGHTSFALSNQVPATAGKRGIVQFQSSGGVSGLGLRFSPFGTFTSVPVIAQ
ncbi:hypothetical protein [Paludibaculum fermentans]|uniref:hypothetical protein n=1 Tax=Paludibaculum fermentans TaxID=1473598 RepID=UPI003EB80285